MCLDFYTSGSDMEEQQQQPRSCVSGYFFGYIPNSILRRPTEMIHKYTEVKCPACNHPLSRAENVVANDEDTAAPRPGDISVCVYCGAILAFERNGQQRLADAMDLNRVEPALRGELVRISRKIRHERH